MSILRDPLVLQAAVALLVALFAALTTMLTAWVRNKVKSEKRAAWIGRALQELSAAVATLAKTVVADLKAANGGKLTRDQADDVKRKAIELAKANLGPVALDAGADLLGVPLENMDRWFGTHLEAELHRLEVAQ